MVTSRKLPSLSKLWDEYGGYVFLIGFIYILWSFRKFFTAIGDAAGGAAEGATAGLQQQVKDKTDRVAATAAAPALKKTGISDSQLAKWRADAKELAGYLGTLPGLQKEDLVPDQASALHLLKIGYSRLLLVNNKPVHYVKNAAGKSVTQNQAKEDSTSIRNPVYWTVLAPFYKEFADGNSLATDLHKYMKDIRYQAILQWII